MNAPNPQPEDLPDSLIDALHRAQDPPTVPESVDRAVLEDAGRVLAQAHIRRKSRWLWPTASAAAACVLLSFGLFAWMLNDTPPESIPATPRIAGDLTQDGQVDILDAFALARQLEDAEPVRTEWDLTGDNRVDQADVDYLAALAVRLDNEVIQ